MLLLGDVAIVITRIVNVEVLELTISLFAVLMGTVTIGIAIVLSTSMSLLLQGIKRQYGKAVALAGFVRFSCGFAITFVVSQIDSVNVTDLAIITIICGVTCLITMTFSKQSNAAFAEVTE